ncbi:uncharacterized protein FTOL_04507 [Fusarium torulosum]|uniref:Uncharacterized protein n=1 Tax=Fusarium torulosum TaxID=33205 RepID=A0AAE8SGI7_9HYPO|nr:uncharacterized protein FTOL_04507 [Fusarium torulosum]
MKFPEFIFVLLLWIFAGKTIADCQYWVGTAPFCDGSCPSNCRTVATSNSGNGGSCWTGYKALCNCCAGPATGPCTPTQTETACYGVVLVCKNVMLVFGPNGEQSITCSTYVCGACIGFSFFLESQERTVPSNGRVVPLLSTQRDVIVRGSNTTEEEIEEVLVKSFGRKLSPDEMKNTTVVKIIHPDISLIRGTEGCPYRDSMSASEGPFRIQRPAAYYQ